MTKTLVRQQHLTPLSVCVDNVAPTKYVCDGLCPVVRSIRRSVCQPVLLSLVTSLVLTRLDYGSVTLNGITKRLQD